MQHQYGHRVSEPVNLGRKRVQGRRMSVKPMIGRIAGNDTHLCAARDRVTHRKAEAAFGFGQIVRRVMQVRKMSEFQIRLRKKHKGRPKAASWMNTREGVKKG
ncbi:hypothetical protein AB6809_27705 [Paraburkholderia sp. RCC_158]|uniref:hypothetical protein n=1 Tax=Paraburkholderia sp. RCC_158 TaxID=3239220 RepID=UPI003525C4CA